MVERKKQGALLILLSLTLTVCKSAMVVASLMTPSPNTRLNSIGARSGSRTSKRDDAREGGVERDLREGVFLLLPQPPPSLSPPHTLATPPPSRSPQKWRPRPGNPPASAGVPPHPHPHHRCRPGLPPPPARLPPRRTRRKSRRRPWPKWWPGWRRRGAGGRPDRRGG